METNIVTLTPPIRGYKAFSDDLKCRDKQYTCPGVFEESGPIKLCEHGMHFCLKLWDVYHYYTFNKNTRVTEVIAEGDVLSNKSDTPYDIFILDTKLVTNKLRIVRELSWDEINKLVNIGEGNIGIGNSGNYNAGHYNTGNYNYGSRNSGDYNFGNENSGNYNIGNYNTGNYNCGTHNPGNFNYGGFNTGNFNYGYYNIGDFNKGSCIHGVFNTTPYSDGRGSNCIMMFNKPSPLTTYGEWVRSAARNILESRDTMIPSLVPLPKFININTCKDKDSIKKAEAALKKLGPTKDTIGITVETTPYSSADRQKWWDDLSDNSKEIILNLPNFDDKIFLYITGIDVNKKPDQ